MEPITDKYMYDMLQKAKPYTIIILHKTAKRGEPGADKIVFDHGRRNFELRRDGKLLVVCPINDKSDVSGIGIFTTTPEETKILLDNDPGVMAGIFTYEIHQTKSFVGDSLK